MSLVIIEGVVPKKINYNNYNNRGVGPRSVGNSLSLTSQSAAPGAAIQERARLAWSHDMLPSTLRRYKRLNPTMVT